MIIFIFLLFLASLTIAIGVFLYLSIFVVSLLKSRIPLVPARDVVLETLPILMPLSPGSHFYDLGAGDGRVVSAMAKAYPESVCIGIETGPYPYLISRWRSFLNPLPNATIRYTDFYKASIQDATHVYLYLFPKVIQKLMPRLLKTLAPGTHIISCDYPYVGQEPLKVMSISPGPLCHTLYLYEVPEEYPL